LILNLLAENNKRLSELVAELPKYHIVKEKYSVDPERLPSVFRALEQRWTEAVVDHADGIRLDWPNRWLHVRPSNTEPIVRVIAEAPTESQARQLCEQAAKVLGEAAHD
jgi:phosphomannomutase